MLNRQKMALISLTVFALASVSLFKRGARSYCRAITYLA